MKTTRTTSRSLGLEMAMLPLVAAVMSLLIGTGGSVEAAGATVRISEWSFLPTPVTISAGQSVTWFNVGKVTHYLNIDTTPSGSSFIASGPILPGHRYSHTFPEAGVFSYRDALYNFMAASVVVKTASTATATPKPTAKPTPRPTPRPTAAPTAKATAKPAATPKPTAKPVASASAGGSESPGGSGEGSSSTGPSGSGVAGIGGTGASAGPAGSVGSPDGGPGGIGLALAVVGLVGLAFLGGLYFATRRRGESSGPWPVPSGGSPGGGPGVAALTGSTAPVQAGPWSPSAASGGPAPADIVAPARLEPGAGDDPAGLEMPAEVNEDAPLQSARRANRPSPRG